MATNLALDDQLILEAMKWGKHKTKRAAVTAALECYVQSRLDQTSTAALVKSMPKKPPRLRGK